MSYDVSPVLYLGRMVCDLGHLFGKQLNASGGQISMAFSTNIWLFPAFFAVLVLAFFWLTFRDDLKGEAKPEQIQDAPLLDIGGNIEVRG